MARMEAREARRGFTLIELTVVIFLMGLIAAVAFPSLLPLIAFSRLEGDARHLSNYGRAVIAEASLSHTEITVRFDFDQQQYYAIKWIYPDEEGGEGENAVDQMDVFSKMRSGQDPEELIGMLDSHRAGEGGTLFGDSDEFDDEAANKQLEDRFSRFARNLVKEQAKNVKHDSFLDEVGDLFEEEDEFALDAENEPVEEELRDPILARTAMSDEVVIDSVVVDEEVYSSGVAEVVISPLGLGGKVVIYITDSGGEYYTIMWDPLTGNSNVVEGREDMI